MKRGLLAASLVCLSIGLGGCNSKIPDGQLRVTVVGPPHAEIHIINQTSKAKVFDGTISGSVVFNNLPQNEILRITAIPSTGYDAPAPVDVRVTKETEVTLSYATLVSPAGN